MEVTSFGFVGRRRQEDIYLTQLHCILFWQIFPMVASRQGTAAALHLLLAVTQAIQALG